MSTFSIRLGLAACCVGILLQGQGLAAESGVFVEIRESEAADARVIERWKLYGSSHALVIGINDYGGGWPRLSKAIEDAQQVADALQARGFEVTLRTDLTSLELRQELTNFYALKGADPDARLVVWYAGHGYSSGGEGYLVPSDAGPPNEPEFFAKALPMWNFGSLARLAKAKHVMAIFDSCFAGTIFNVQRSRPPAAISQAIKNPVRQFLTSGDADQQVTDDGTFSGLFIDAINGDEPADANGDGYVTGTELSFYLEDRLTNLTQGHQTPRSGKLRDRRFDQGDFVFVLPRKQTSESEAVAPQPTFQSNDALFWASIKDSEDPGEYEDYLLRFPRGTFSGLAERRRASLREQQQAALTQPKASAPEIEVEEMDAPYRVIKRANVRAGPSVEFDQIELLEVGEKVTATGDLIDKDWLRIALADGTRGYIYAPLIEDEKSYQQSVAESKERKEERRQTKLQEQQEEAARQRQANLQAEARRKSQDTKQKEEDQKQKEADEARRQTKIRRQREEAERQKQARLQESARRKDEERREKTAEIARSIYKKFRIRDVELYPEIRTEFKKYLGYQDYKAFAFSPKRGPWWSGWNEGWGHSFGTLSKAIEGAMESCESRRSNRKRWFAQCVLYSIGDKVVAGMSEQEFVKTFKNYSLK